MITLDLTKEEAFMLRDLTIGTSGMSGCRR